MAFPSLRARALVVIVAAGTCIAGCSSSSSHASAHAGPTTTTVPRRTVVQDAAYDAQLSTFATALNASGLLATVGDGKHYIVFAPDNTAFAKLPHATFVALLSRAGKARLARALQGHIVKTTSDAATLEPGTLTALNGEKLTITRDASGLTITDAHGHHAHVETPPLEATNGAVYRLDSVLGSG